MDRDPCLYGNDSYEDVTEDFKKYAAQMKVGELVHTSDFKLFDAINAFQIGSARMDTGLTFRPLEKELASLPAIESAQDVCDLIDIVLAMEMSWHQGNMLLRTILCCLPVEQMAETLTQLAPSNFRVVTEESSRILQFLESKMQPASWADVADIYTLATLKACSMTMKLIESEPAIILEGEDFHITHGDYYMLENTPVDLVARLVEAAMRFAKFEKPLGHRLQLRFSWLQVLKLRFPKKPVHLTKMLESLEIYEGYDFDRPNPLRVILSDGVQSRAASFSLAQPLGVIGLKEAVEQWKQLATSLRDLGGVTGLTRSADLMGFFLVFSSQRQLPIVRVSLKQIVSTTDILGQSVRTWVIKDVRELSYPGWDPAKHRTLYEPFMVQASHCYVDLITTFLLNRPMQRENLVALVSQFDSLQVTADEIDEKAAKLGQGRKLRTGSGQEMWALELSAAVHLRKLQIMLWIVLMTLELDIAVPWEYPWVYWYATQLCQRLIDHLGRLKAYFEQHSLRSTEEGYPYLVALELEARGLSQVCSAQYLMHVALDQRGLVQRPRSPLTADLSLQYGLRFQVFQSVGMPPMATLDEFETVSAKLTPELALEAARNSLTGARSLLKTLTRVTKENSEMQLIARSCVGLQLALVQIEKAPAGARLEYERDGYHRYFPVVKICIK